MTDQDLRECFARFAAAHQQALPSMAVATAALLGIAHPGEAARLRAAQAEHEQFLVNARAYGFSTELAERILAVASTAKAQHLCVDPYVVANQLLKVVDPS